MIASTSLKNASSSLTRSSKFSCASSHPGSLYATSFRLVKFLQSVTYVCREDAAIAKSFSETALFSVVLLPFFAHGESHRNNCILVSIKAF
jgi:hypothetical protein